MKYPELLSPVGDFDCLKAAVQNGANSVYLGASSFSARASAKNFNLDELKEAVKYAKLRNVKVNLALNTLLKNNELEEAIKLATYAYNIGVDAIIIQDLGLFSFLKNAIPNLAFHASTQMSIHNLEGVQQLEKLGFSRVVLSRELSLNEINNICQNSNIEIETFIHGALCISYSGQCLFSSMIGGRSGNRGKCAGPCRLPYELLSSSNGTLDKGYLLSPRDLCSLEHLPQLIKSGVDCFKIEGRLKSPEYVATITRIYRKYIDFILNNEKYEISSKDVNDLIQVFNRGNFSSGHLLNMPNKELIYKERPDNQGIFLGTVHNFNPNKGYITLKTNNSLSIGDKIRVEDFKRNASNYTISELMIDSKNISSVSSNTIVKIGRMKGNIRKGDKIYKMSSNELSCEALKTYSGNEIKKIKLNANLKVKNGEPISLTISPVKSHYNYFYNTEILEISNIIPTPAINAPITKERLISQISKTGSTQFEFDNINIELDDNLYVPSISGLNELRRNALQKLEEQVLINNTHSIETQDILQLYNSTFKKQITSTPDFSFKENQQKISLLLNILNSNIDYTLIENVNRIYIPFHYFLKENYYNTIKSIASKHNIYIYMPAISRETYTKLFNQKLETILDMFNIKGFVVSNYGQLEICKKFNLDLIANYNFNIYNNLAENKLNDFKFTTYTISPELDKTTIESLLEKKNLYSEMITYGNTPLMYTNYCLLGRSNQCYNSCEKNCTKNDKYFLKDRMNFNFRILPDSLETVTTIYNSKTTSILGNQFNVNSFRIDILDESISEINEIIKRTLNNERLEGQNYTNGNLNKEI